MAFAGNANNVRGFSRGGGESRFAFRSHNGWSHDRQYAWNGRHYRWYNNGWFTVDPYPYYAAGYPYDGNYDYEPDYPVYGSPDDEGTGDSTGVQVQRELARDGYYRGTIDGIVGPGTRAAIAAYQRDEGLRVTGAIDSRLLDSLNVD